LKEIEKIAKTQQTLATPIANQNRKPGLQTRIANQDCKPGSQTSIAIHHCKPAKQFAGQA